MGELFANFKGYDWQATRAEGIEEGKKVGRSLVNDLIVILMKDKRYDDLEKAAEDIEYQNELIKELLPEEWAKYNDETVPSV